MKNQYKTKINKIKNINLTNPIIKIQKMKILIIIIKKIINIIQMINIQINLITIKNTITTKEIIMIKIIDIINQEIIKDTYNQKNMETMTIRTEIIMKGHCKNRENIIDKICVIIFI